MSLLVHLPLTGNLENKGLANVTVTNNGATVDNNGKIGKCYSFSNNSIMINYALPATEHEWSYCCWAKLNNNSETMCLYSSRTSVNSAQRTIFLLDNKGVCFDDGTRISGTLNTTATLTNWCHYAFSRSSNKINVYVNGSLAFSSSITAFPSSVSTNTFFGASQNSNTTVNAFYLAGSLNDIRIYDHALSPKEVKELSKGLVAHYKLDDIGINSNLISSRRSYNPSSYLAYQFNLKENLVEGQTYTFQLWNVDVSHSGKTAEQLGISVFWGGGWVQLKTMNGTSYFTDGHADYLTFTITITASQASGNGASNPYLQIYNSIYNAEGTLNMNIGAIKVEKGNVPTMYTPDNVTDNTIYDCSGYGNNGTTVGTLSLSSNSPRYEYNCVLTTSNYITINNTFLNLAQPFSISCFSSFTGAKNQVAISVHDQISSRIFNFCSNGSAQNQTCLFTPPVGYIGVQSGTIRSGWGHYVMVYNGTKLILYRDGVLLYDQNANNTTYSNNAPTDSIIKLYSCPMSDVRFYCTALSAEDVKELYDTSAFITDNGTTECYEFDEVDNQLTIGKNGIMKIGNIYEAEAKYTDALPVTVLKTSFSQPTTGTNRVSKFFSFPLENAIPGKVYTVEYDFIWEGTWDASGGTLSVHSWGEQIPKSGYSTGYDTRFNYAYESFVVTSTSGTYHYKGNFTMISTCQNYTTWNVGVRVDYSDGNGQYKLENFKIYPVEMRIDTEQTKIGNDYVTSREFIEI